MLAPGLLGQQSAEDFRFQLAGIFTGRVGSDCDRRGGISMQLKLFVLSGSALILWLTPLTVLDKRIGWHKSVQALSLGAGIACAVSAGNIARKLAEENEIEELKTRAIKADVVDEISTSVYISQAQRQQEAEAVLASPMSDVEEARQALEAIYSGKSDKPEVISLATVSESSELDKSLYAEICKSREAGKTNTWIIENILKMKGRKFAEGKVRLQNLLSQFEGE